MKDIIDLHIHSSCSDGEFNPRDIIDEAIRRRVNIISICDHDSVDAYQDEIIRYAEENNIKLITGVEISTSTNKGGIHILGYGFDLYNSEFREKLYNLKNSRHIYLKEVSVILKELGYKVDVERLDKIEAVTKAHIANDVINNIENKEKLVEVFGHVPQMGEFIENIMNEDCPAYVKKKTITPKEASNLIHSANGKVVLAHPVAYIYENNMSIEDIEHLIEEINLDGIESNYIYIDSNNIKHNDINVWNEVAKKYNLYTTIGSDFHKIDGLHPVIGLFNEEINLDFEDINRIKKFLCD